MKMNNLQMVNIGNILEGYAEKRLPQRISYAITRNMSLIQKDYSVYDAALKKLFASYQKDFLMGEDGKPIVNEIGLPEVNENSRAAFNTAVSELLNCEIDVELYTIDSSCFNYEDSERYDAMSARDIMILQSILCAESGEQNDA